MAAPSSVVPELPIERIGCQDLDAGDYLVMWRVPFRLLP
jgi:hypothetical protein